MKHLRKTKHFHRFIQNERNFYKESRFFSYKVINIVRCGQILCVCGRLAESGKPCCKILHIRRVVTLRALTAFAWLKNIEILSQIHFFSVIHLLPRRSSLTKREKSPCLVVIIINTVQCAHSTFMELNDKSIKEKRKIGRQQDIYIGQKRYCQ